MNGEHKKPVELPTEETVCAWEPIESAPKTGQCVLLACGNWMIVGHWHRTHQCWANNGPTYEALPRDEQPTHWAPLPQGPA